MTDLISALDAAAQKLLAQAGLSADTPIDAKIEATPAERVKAFDSVLDYAKIRPTLVPKEEKESPFDAIRRDFNGEKVERRGRPRKDKASVDPVAPAGANGAEIRADNLFDA
jgi:hypothetical protein